MSNGIRMRRDVAGMTINDPPLKDYNQAVGIMKTRFPSSDPRSWAGQANIHSGFCPHGNWFFLPWHRAYVLAFENIVRDVLQKPDFALPYWNWTKDPGIPAPFFQGNLVDNTRHRGPGDRIPPSNVGQPVIDDIMRQTDFELFASFKPRGQDDLSPRWQRAGGAKATLERTPHDQTHVWVNGNMVTMLSPLDPVFWLHHGNIDRLWAQWNSQGRRNTTDRLWVDFPFNANFVDPQGRSVNFEVGGVQDVRALGYTYDTLPQAQPRLADAAALDGIAERPSLLERVRTRYVASAPRTAGLREEASFSVDTPRSAVPLAAAAADAADPLAAEALLEETKVLALVRDVEPPANVNVTVNVFLNCPYLTPETPTTDPHYVGNFTFFGVHGDEGGGDEHGGHHHGHGHEGHPSTLEFGFDITDTVARLRALEPDLEERLTLQLVPLPQPGVDVGNVEVKVGSVEFVYV